MELGSEPAVFREGDMEAQKLGNAEGTPLGGSNKTGTIIAAVAVVVILAGGIVGALLYFKKTPTSVPG